VNIPQGAVRRRRSTFIFTQITRGTFPARRLPRFSTDPTPERLLTLRSDGRRSAYSLLRGPIGFRCRLCRISIQTVSGSGTIGLFKRMRALSGKTRAMATALAASLGTEKTPVCPTRYGPTRFFKSSASLRAQRPLRLPPHHRAPVRRRPQRQRPLHLAALGFSRTSTA
jgi:hypothetical protein